MYKRLLVGSMTAVFLFAGVAVADQLQGGRVYNGPALPEVASGPGCCPMQKGFVVNTGIGCSNGVGTSGGPNDVAEKFTLCTPAPVTVCTFSYIVVTPGVPGFATGCSFAAWGATAGGAPGATACVGPPVPFLTAGTFSIPISSCKITPGDTSAGCFFAGMAQGGIGGMRWGYEDGGASGDAWIRASGCGAPAFINLGAAGFLGDWVFRVTVQPQGPIEVEDFSWGQIKSLYQ